MNEPVYVVSILSRVGMEYQWGADLLANMDKEWNSISQLKVQIFSLVKDMKILPKLCFNFLRLLKAIYLLQ